jgi:hypothetical protein
MGPFGCRETPGFSLVMGPFGSHVDPRLQPLRDPHPN